jgi:hypothetical protein
VKPQAAEERMQGRRVAEQGRRTLPKWRLLELRGLGAKRSSQGWNEKLRIAELMAMMSW